MKLRHLTVPLFEGMVSSEAVAKAIASDDDLWDAVAQFVSEDHMGPEAMARITALIQRVKPFSPYFTLYRGEPEGTYGRPDRGFISATANPEVAKRFAQESGGRIKQLVSPYQGVSIESIVKWRMRLTGESQHPGEQAEWLVLQNARMA